MSTSSASTSSSANERNGASPLGIAANRAAYLDGDRWLADVIDYLDGSRRLLGELLAARLPAVGYRAPDATYLTWLDCRWLGLPDPAAFFLDRARVAVADGSSPVAISGCVVVSHA